MTFAQRVKDRTSLVEARLFELLGENSGPHPSGGSVSQRLSEAMRRAVLSGGKRIRPFLVMETAGLFGVPDERAVDAAAALECVHCYSLVHDDLPSMDNDEMRRGQSTIWKAYDEWTAVLVGDALLTFAFDILARPTTHPEPATRVALVATLAQAAGASGMAGGQALDLEAEKLGTPAMPTRDHVLRLQGMKTGALITCACEMGAILGAASADERDALHRFGRSLGSAFQIADDLLDAEGDAATVGKAVAKDAAAGKATLVAVIGIKAARAELQRTEAEANAALAIFGKGADMLREMARFVASRKS